MSKLNKFAKVGIKIVEIVHWAMVVAGLILLTTCFVAPNTILELLSRVQNELRIYSYTVELLGHINESGLSLIKISCVALILMCGLMAMISRNIYLIFMAMEGRNKNMQEAGPFQKDIARMVREIGIFFISMPVVGFLLSIAIRLVMGPEIAEISVDIGSVVIGIVVLCLSEVFTYGQELQEEVDGLL